MKQKIRTPIKLIILTALILGLSATAAFAADYNGSTVKGTSSCGSGSFENTASGYRMYLCNPEGDRVSITKAENI